MALDKQVYPSATDIMESRFHPPADDVATETSAVSGQASVSVAAGTNGQRYVVTAFSFRVSPSAGNLAAGTVGAYIIDGATATTTYLWRELLFVASTGCECFRQGLNLTGSADTALTIEFSGAVTGAQESVNMTYHQIGGRGGA